jgi:hypothetical protein
MSEPAIDPKPSKFSRRAYCLALTILILLNFGKAMTFIGAGQAFPEEDGINYWIMGSSFSHGDWLLRERDWAFRTPAYPAFLGGMQAAFGDHALLAVSVVQQLLVFAIALITAWICAKVTRSRAGALVGLTLSFFCISRSCFAVFAMADNLLCAVLVLYFALLLAWLNQPSYWKAGGMGALIAMAVLLKPVAEVLCVFTLPLIAYHLWRSSCFKRFWLHAAVMLVVMVALVFPWVIRNKIVFGEYFLSRFTGRTLWITCRVGRPEQMPVSFSDGPKTRALSAELAGTGATIQSSSWVVSRALASRGYRDNEVDKLMQGVMQETILAHPGQYLAGRPLRFLWFWVNPKAWCDNRWGLFYSHRGLPVGWGASEHPSAFYSPDGQVAWSVPCLAAVNTAFLKVVWHPNLIFNALVALAVALGCLFMLWKSEYRQAGLAVASVLLAISLATSCFSWPEYRFRMPLEPVMIVAVAPALISLYQWFAGRVGRKTVG